MKGETTLWATLATAIALGVAPVRAQQEDSSAASRDDLILAERRDELIFEADQTLEELRGQDELAAALLEEAYGHAVFDATKGGLILTGSGGTGVARANDGSDVTFMRLGGAGIGLGAGFENYKLVMLFEDQSTYSSFIAGQWDGALAAQAAAGTAGASTEEQFVGGVRVFRITDGGLMAQLDATALRFWPYDRLNRAVEIEEQIVAAASGDVPEEIADREAARERVTADDTNAAARGDAARSADGETFAEIENRFAGDDAAPLIGPSHPERLDELAAQHADLESFVEAVEAAGLADSLTGTTRYTLFAPTNEAFESMSGMTREELLAPENRDELVRLLRAHIVADDLDREMARNIPEALTLNGETVSVDVEGDRFTVGNAAVVESDIENGNLRVHVVDGLLSSPVQVAEADIEEAGADGEAEADIDVAEAEVEVDGDDASEPESSQDVGREAPSGAVDDAAERGEIERL